MYKYVFNLFQFTVLFVVKSLQSYVVFNTNQKNQIQRNVKKSIKEENSSFMFVSKMFESVCEGNYSRWIKS